MKANKAPEKIYLEWYRIGDKKYRDWCIIPKTNDESVEYTRTDAFIEKALKFIKANVDRIVNNQHGVCIGCMDGEFRKYMEGE